MNTLEVKEEKIAHVRGLCGRGRELCKKPCSVIMFSENNLY